MKSRRWFVKCEICGRGTHRKGNDEKRDFMAKFPLDEVRCREWVKAVGKEDLVYVPIEKLHARKHLCAGHFQKKHFNSKRNRLKSFAVPTENLTRDPLPDEMLLEFPCHVSSEPFFDGLIMSHAESLTSEHNYWVKRKDSLLDSLKKRTSGSGQRTVSFNQHSESTVDDEYAPEGDDLATDQEPPGPTFSWQETSLITLDEPQTGSENFPLLQSKEDRNVDHTNTSLEDAVTATDYTCNECRKHITGYTCVQCVDYDLCGACAAALMHLEHYMLRVPGSRPQREVKIVLDALRKNLKLLKTDISDDITRMECELVIKKEEDPFGELPTWPEAYQEETCIEGISNCSEVPNVSNKKHATDEQQIERNRNHGPDDLEFDSENVKVVQEKDAYDSGSEDWLDESLLDIGDDIISNFNENNQQTSHHITDKLDKNLGREKIKKPPLPTFIKANDAIEETISLNRDVKRKNDATVKDAKEKFRKSQRLLNLDGKRKKDGVPCLEDPITRFAGKQRSVSKKNRGEDKILKYRYTETKAPRFSNTKVLSKPVKIKINENFANDMRASPRLPIRATSASKTIGKSTNDAGNSLAGKQVKLTGLKNTGEHKSRMPDDGQQPNPSKYHMIFTQKKMAVRLEDISKALLPNK